MHRKQMVAVGSISLVHTGSSLSSRHILHFSEDVESESKRTSSLYAFIRQSPQTMLP
jgi:hypothetical protein